MTIGEKLRNAREAKNMTLVELQEKTKIQLRYLESIENDQFKSLPGEYNTKLFLRSYARYVDIDPDEIIREYNGEPVREYQEAYEKQETRGSRYEQNNSAKAKKKNSKFLPLLILMIVFVIIIGSVGYAFVKEHDRFAANSDLQTEYSISSDSSKKEEHVKQKTETTPSSTVKPKKVVKKPKMKMKVTSASMNNVAMKVTNVNKKATLVVKGSQGRCWVSALAGGRSLYQGVIEYGQKETLNIPAGTRQVVLQFGNAPMVSMTLNNKTVEYDNSQLTSKQITLTMNLSYAS